MRFISFNINGLRAHFHQLEEIIIQLQPDVLALQETKIHDDIFPTSKIANYGYHIYQHGQKKHYGVALICRQKPLTTKNNFISDINTNQARIIMAEFVTTRGLLTIINGYFPQGENRNNITKFTNKQNFYKNLQKFIQNNYDKKSLLLIMGDMNISPHDLDVGIGKKNYKKWLATGKCSFLSEEKEWINSLLNCGLIDIYRHIYPKVNNRYSWFDYRSKAFSNNKGLRIDLLLASYPLISFLKDSGINYEIRAMHKPSDHAPIWADFYIQN
ncbi:exodeoxyribonuclease III [Blochmannia endosymbiont of Camponotus (Colobopsis) obliquus]|uniref:exodeoxyribonuclease III n=1 Tax=Blochmannia endosymbiont of Camponotus (Colobopsis) obliquus TaxID=1505597 RepID=UPI00061A77DD|nr:exodeoxyribonuclease III [Blochmannia endosymbiont of Camponotus (Colobopsis) obliquus]AKC60590.1 exodeoxyribonuclease III [Blochmannia endosymbiont of Camponotus (Colobopsis) obliquus]